MKSFGVHIVEGLGNVLVKPGRLNNKSVIMATRRNWYYMTHCVETRNPKYSVKYVPVSCILLLISHIDKLF